MAEREKKRFFFIIKQAPILLRSLLFLSQDCAFSHALFHLSYQLLQEISSLSKTCLINRPYFPRPRKYRRLFSEPTYWPRRSWSQYGEGNNQAGIFEAEGNKSLIPGNQLAHHWLVLLLEKFETKASCLCVASAAMLVRVVRGFPIRSGFIDFFPPAIVNSQIAQVDRTKILEQMDSGSSPLLRWSLCYFFLFKLRT